MENNIKTFTIFSRQDERSENIARRIRNFNSMSDEPLEEINDGELVIAIGGDGTFLKAVDVMDFNNSKVFAGIHTGTLGFLQDLSESDVYSLIKYIRYEKNLKVKKIPVLDIKITEENGKIRNLKAFNEILICGNNYSKIKFKEIVQDEFFQEISGNGIIIASGSGDTAYSMNAGGVINFSLRPVLSCSLISPIKNAAYTNFISNPITCNKIKVVLSEEENLRIIIDGNFKDISPKYIESVEVSMPSSESYINKLELESHSKVEIVRRKILGYEF